MCCLTPIGVLYIYIEYRYIIQVAVAGFINIIIIIMIIIFVRFTILTTKFTNKYYIGD